MRIKIKQSKNGKLEEYELCVFRITGRNVLNQPQTLTIVHKDQTVTLADVDPETGRPFEFMTGFLPVKMLKEKL